MATKLIQRVSFPAYGEITHSVAAQVVDYHSGKVLREFYQPERRQLQTDWKPADEREFQFQVRCYSQQYHNKYLVFNPELDSTWEEFIP